MYGLEAINANNGWAISVVGISIVFSGLVMLSLVISQLHKGIDLIENPQKIKDWFASKGKKTDRAVLVISDEQKEIAKQYALLVRTMEDHFSLPRLLRLAVVSGLKDSHDNLNMLLKSGIITPDGQGMFTWDQDLFTKTISY
ncbi:MAG: OadG family protein [Desulfobacter sp.]|nr:MAG: OadG family protein [Desulfobacter sp.]